MCDDCGQEDPNVSLTVYLQYFTTLYFTTPYQPEQPNGCGIVNRPQLTATTQHTLSYTWQFIINTSLNCTVQDQTFCLPLEGLTKVYKCTLYDVYKKGLTWHTHVLLSPPARPPSCIMASSTAFTLSQESRKMEFTALAGAWGLQRSELGLCFLWSVYLAF